MGSAPDVFRVLSIIGLRKEVSVPTIVHFIGTEDPVTVAEDFAAVRSALQGRAEGQFKRLPGDNLVAIYKTGVAYIEQAIEDEILSPADLPA
jgi:hypothetical protein